MRTKSGPDEITPLPPPPAPPARDANPWPWPEQESGAGKRPSRLASMRSAGRRDRQEPPSSSALSKSVAIGVAILVITTALIEALGRGGAEDWAGAALVLLLLAIFALRQLRGASKRAARRQRGDDAG
jgi:peptidoglycan/LPS O-acetylase OafA/YrhL